MTPVPVSHRAQCLSGVRARWDSFYLNLHLVLKSSDPRATRSEGWSDLCRWPIQVGSWEQGPQGVIVEDLKGRRVRSHAGVPSLLVRDSLRTWERYFKINSLMHSSLCWRETSWNGRLWISPSRCSKRSRWTAPTKLPQTYSKLCCKLPMVP